MSSAVLSVDAIHELVEGRELRRLSETVKDVPTWRLTEFMEETPSTDAAVLFRLLDKDTAVEVFDDLAPATQVDLIDLLGHAETAEVFAELEADEQARLLDESPARVAKRLLASLDQDNQDLVSTLLGYPEKSVGRQMEPALCIARTTESLGDVRERIRAADGIGEESLTELPVVDTGRRLVGILRSIELLRHDDDTSVAEVMSENPDFAETDDDAETIARRILHSGYLVFPVVDRDRRLVGIMPIGDAAAIDRAAIDEDTARAGGSEPLRRPYLLTSVRAVARARATWLVVLALSAVLTVQVLEIFEDTLGAHVVLALFIPLLIGIGGNTGAQAATTVTRALSLGTVRLRDFPAVAFKELRTGLLLGMLLGALAFAVASLIYGVGVGTVIGLTIVLNCSIAAMVGGLVPLAAHACKVDPAVFSTPFISTFCDATGLLVYFSVAIVVLGI